MLLAVPVALTAWLPGCPQPHIARLPPLPRTRVPQQCVPAYIDLSGDGGCLFQRLDDPPASAEQPALRGYVTVHWRAALTDGTRLYDSREAAEPLEVRVGLQPSDTVRHLLPLPGDMS